MIRGLMGSSILFNIFGLLLKSHFMLRQAQHEPKSQMISNTTARPEPVEGQTAGLGNSPSSLDPSTT
jgi:hypothetical protein